MRISPLCLALALAFALACGTRASLPPPRPVRPPSPPAPVPWSRFDDISAWPTVGEPFANLGHAGAGALGLVRVSPDARATYEALVRDSTMPDGTVVALFHGERPGHEPGAVYVMEKAGGAWSFRLLTPRGVIVEEAVSRCAGCHESGVGDSLFGLPRAADAGR